MMKEPFFLFDGLGLLEKGAAARHGVLTGRTANAAEARKGGALCGIQAAQKPQAAIVAKGDQGRMISVESRGENPAGRELAGEIESLRGDGDATPADLEPPENMRPAVLSKHRLVPILREGAGMVIDKDPGFPLAVGAIVVVCVIGLETVEQVPREFGDACLEELVGSVERLAHGESGGLDREEVSHGDETITRAVAGFALV